MFEDDHSVGTVHPQKYPCRRQGIGTLVRPCCFTAEAIVVGQFNADNPA